MDTLFTNLCVHCCWVIGTCITVPTYPSPLILISLSCCCTGEAGDTPEVPAAGVTALCTHGMGHPRCVRVCLAHASRARPSISLNRAPICTSSQIHGTASVPQVPALGLAWLAHSNSMSKYRYSRYRMDSCSMLSACTHATSMLFPDPCSQGLSIPFCISSAEWLPILCWYPTRGH
jgi:hypothetical protein